MGLATTFALVSSAVLISLFRRMIPREVRIPVYTVTVATLVTVADLTLASYIPAIHRVLGIYLPLIIVNCIILGRIEAFAGSNPVGRSFLDAMGYGLGFTWALTLIGGIRELFGAGTLFGVQVMPQGFEPLGIMRSPPGAFITMGLLVGGISFLRQRFSKEETPAQAPAVQSGAPGIAGVGVAANSRWETDLSAKKG